MSVNIILVVILVLIGSLQCSVSANKPESRQCTDKEFHCENGQCIPKRLQCDRINHCLDNSDEENCSSTCTPNEFQCKNGDCVLKMRRCDDSPDCKDNSDEMGCNSTTSTSSTTTTTTSSPCEDENCQPSNSNCINCSNFTLPDAPTTPISDTLNRTKCNNRTDEQFTCVADGVCIPLSRKCNGNSDCSDESDEKDCSPNYFIIFLIIFIALIILVTLCVWGFKTKFATKKTYVVKDREVKVSCAP